jgi:anti-sigma regulatory factor (Ser/Thr protein kinase)
VTAIHTTAFAHSAFLYDDREELLERALPFLQQGAESGQALLVAMPRAQLQAIRGELDGDRADACFMEIEELGRNPARLTAAYRELADRAEDGICGISEALWVGRSEAEIEECERHEMVLNRAFEALPTCSLLCVYDRSELDQEVVGRVGRTHPELIENSQPAYPSATYEARPDPFAGTLPRSPREAEQIEFDEDRLGAEREFLRAAAERACLSSERTADLVLAGNELATNSVEHGGGSGTMRVWREDEMLLCEVADEGRIEAAMVGRLRPPIEQPRGRGIWLANQVADLLQIRSSADGTTLRLAISCAG